MATSSSIMTWSPDLPSAPRSLRHQEVSLTFVKMTPGDPSRGFIPGYHFQIRNDQGEDVGHLNFRVGESEHVCLAAGHLGYEILEAHRGHGYAAQACLALAPFIAEVSGSILITVDPDNLPSIRTVERIGASFIDEVDVPKNDPHYLRGSFRKRRYRWEPEAVK